MARIAGILTFAMFLMLPAPLGAQGRGGHAAGRGAVIARPAPAVAFAPAVPSPVTRFVGRPVTPFAAAPGAVPIVRGSQFQNFRPQHFQNGRPQRTVIVTQPFGFYSPYFWGDPYQPAVYPQTVYPQTVYAEAPALQEPAVSQNELELSYQVGQLSQEIEQLRAEQAGRTSRDAQSVPDTPATPTVLVFRDGHRTEIQNYAIIGPTLWVLDAKTSTKISIADLDLDATQKENRSRGVRFALPR